MLLLRSKSQGNYTRFRNNLRLRSEQFIRVEEGGFRQNKGGQGAQPVFEVDVSTELYRHIDDAYREVARVLQIPIRNAISPSFDPTFLAIPQLVGGQRSNLSYL